VELWAAYGGRRNSDGSARQDRGICGTRRSKSRYNEVAENEVKQVDDKVEQSETRSEF